MTEADFYMDGARKVICTTSTQGAMLRWWEAQTPLRRKYRVSDEQEAELVELIEARFPGIFN